MNNLIYPLFGQFFLTQIVLIITFVSRVVAVNTRQMDFRYLKTYDYGNPTDLVKKTSRHFINLFEMPTLFYVGGVLALARNLQDPILAYSAWGFFITRVFHAFIHIGPNKITPRMTIFGLSVIALNIFWFRLFILLA